MSKRHQHAAPAADYGAQPWRVTVEDVPDPDAPNRTIRRARVTDPVADLERRGVITRAETVAAQVFREWKAIVAGAREGTGSVRLEPWQRCHYAPRVAAARQAMTAAIQAVGLRLGEPFRMAVMGETLPCGRQRYVPLREIDRRLRLASGSAEDLVAEALLRLLAWQSRNGH